MEDTEPTPIRLHPTHTAAYAWLGGGFNLSRFQRYYLVTLMIINNIETALITHNDKKGCWTAIVRELSSSAV